jgi:hypothetical protein
MYDMIMLKVCEDYIKLTSYEQLDVNESENYDIHYSELMISKNEIDAVIELLQDYKNAP